VPFILGRRASLLVSAAVVSHTLWTSAAPALTYGLYAEEWHLTHTVTAGMLDLAKHIVNQKAGHFEPDKFEDQYETALVDLINQKRAGKPITAKERPRGENVVDLMDALRKSIGGAGSAKDARPAKKPRKVASGQKEMLMPIAGKKPAKEAAAKKPAAKPQRKSA
jgi:DNA end-binding protein Ku